uniref:RHS repeat domain-containing protein n=1 Tax=Marinimicrobium alkaliphilum TaxID=2202654 RepID=UPI0018E0BF92
DRQRYKRIDQGTGGTTTTLYIGSVEKIHYPDNTVHWRRQIGGVAIIKEERTTGGGLINSETHYVIRDHLGSTSLLTDHTGAVTQEFYYDPWGQPRKPVFGSGSYWPQPDQPFRVVLKPDTTRGYTDHEHLDEVGLIHMNGRVYDPKLARFVQADPIVQDPSTTRSLNRYSYVWNNPLNATDPSGFVCDSVHSVEECDPGAEKSTRELRAERREEERREANESRSRVRVGGPAGASMNSTDNGAGISEEIVVRVRVESREGAQRVVRYENTVRFMRASEREVNLYDHFNQIDGYYDWVSDTTPLEFAAWQSYATQVSIDISDPSSLQSALHDFSGVVDDFSRDYMNFVRKEFLADYYSGGVQGAVHQSVMQAGARLGGGRGLAIFTGSAAANAKNNYQTIQASQRLFHANIESQKIRLFEPQVFK